MLRIVFTTMIFFISLSFFLPLLEARGLEDVDRKKWKIFIDPRQNPYECWADAEPSKIIRNGRAVFQHRDDMHLQTSFVPSENVIGQVAVVSKHKFKRGASIELIISSKKFKLEPVDNVAWPRSVSEDKKVVRALKKGSIAILKVTNPNGLISEYMFSLGGYTAATNAAASKCKVKF